MKFNFRIAVSIFMKPSLHNERSFIHEMMFIKFIYLRFMHAPLNNKILLSSLKESGGICDITNIDCNIFRW